MRWSVLHRTAFGLGVASRATVSALAVPVRAAGRLLKRLRWRGGVAPRRLPPHREGPAPTRALARPRRAPLDADAGRRRLAAAEAGELEAEKATPVLLELLHDLDAEVRREAAEAAGRARATGTTFALILALEDPAPAVRESAARSVRRMTGLELQLDERSRIERAQLEELKRWWKEQRLAALTGKLPR